jgi:TRAP-type C4-dicarboxylate transport system substrate-binding protein
MGKTTIFAIVVVAITAGCSPGAGKTKAGVGASRTVRLTMPAPDPGDPNLAYFVQQVKQRTAGRVQIVVDGDTYTSVDPDNELRLVRALRNGKVGIAYVPSRAWERDGITGFRALQAPFLIDSYALLHGITIGAIAERMLATLNPVRLVGLGLVPNELRRPLGRKPLISAQAFHGARIRVPTSPTSMLDLRAVGAVPLTRFTAHQVSDALLHGTLDGVESEMHSIEDNSYESVAHFLPSNLTLFAKAQVIVIRPDALARLTHDQQRALREAAAATVAHADPGAQERSEVARLCSEGLHLIAASARDRDSLRRASATAYTALERDAFTKSMIRAITLLKSHVPTAASSLPPCRPAQKPAPSNVAFPQGRFASTLTAADFRKGGAGLNPHFPVPWVITIKNGTWQTNEHPPFGGRYEVHGNQITFLIKHPPDANGNRETVTWSFFRGQLTFKIVAVDDSGSRVIYTAHPWRQIGS